MALTIPSLSVADQADLNFLLDQLEAKQRRNQLRAAYYDAKRSFRPLDGTLPPSMRNLATVLGWPAKAVDTLNNRCVLERFVWPGDDSSVLDQVWDDNWLGQEAPGWQASALIHAVAWIITTRGDVQSGEPKALITGRDAMSGTGVWDVRRRALSMFLSVIEVDDDSKPTHLVLYRPAGNLTLRKGDGGAWSWDWRPHDLGRVPVEPLRYKPRLGRPFGSSRISRPVMKLTDLAVRTVIRSEVSGEFYSIPPRFLLNASEEAFKDANGNPLDAWRLVFGRVLAIEPASDEGPPVDVKQLPQGSQEPHMAQLRGLSYMFAGETSIPPDSLGFQSDANPTSEGAYYASREDLITLAESTVDYWEPAYRRSALTAVQIHEERDDVPDEWRKVRAQFRDPKYTSRSQAADSLVKNAQVMPWLAESDTAVELLGYDETTTLRLLADKRKAQGRATLAALTAAADAIPG